MAGVVTVPGSTGTVSESLPGEPALIIFQGTNWLTEDTVETSGPGGAAKRGLFRGHCGRAWDNPSAQYQNSMSEMCNHAVGRQWRNSKAITMIHHTTVGATLYEATCAFTTNGFDLTFSTAAAGGYKIVYLALYNMDNAVSMGQEPALGFIDADLGFVPRSFLAYAQRAGGGTGADSTNTVQTSGTFSSARWNTDGRFSLAGCSSHLFSDSTSGQWVNELYGTRNFTGGFAGNFGRLPTFPTFAMNMEGWSWSLDNVNQELLTAGAAVDAMGGAVLAWDDLSECDDILPAAATGNTAVVNDLTIRPAAALFYGISDVPREQNNFGLTGTMPTAFMLGLTTPNFQWCACVDFEDFLGSAYQSFNTSICDRLDGANAHTASVELTTNGFIATTVDDDVSPSSVGWAVLGGRIAAGLPQIYRRRIA